MSFTYLPAPETYQSIDRQLSRSPTPNKRYGFIKSESLDDTDTCSDRTSEEENDYRKAQPKHEIVEETKNVKNKERKNSFFSMSHNNNNHHNDNNNNNNNSNHNHNNNNSNSNNHHSNHNGEEKERKNSHFSISNVKRKLSHTFQRRNSTSTSPEMSRRKAPLKSKSSNFNNIHISPNSSPPELRRYAAVKNSHSHNEARWKGSTSMTHVHDKQYNPPESRGRKSSNNLMHPLVMSRKRSAGNPFAYASNPDIMKSTIPYNDKDSMKEFNIYCLGTKQTGKTALTVRFLTGRYIHEYTSSPVEKYSRVMKYGEDRVNVSVFINDVDRMEEDIELGANSGIMIIYSITDKTSFKEANLLLNHLQELSITDHIPVVLIATKMDLNRLRKIKQKRALDLANQFNCSQFDVSAAQDENVQDCFHAVFRQIEVRQFLKGNSEDDKTILTPRKFKSSGSFRYSTL